MLRYPLALFILPYYVLLVCGRESQNQPTRVIPRDDLPTATANTADFTLSNDFDINNSGVTREYTWTISKAVASPDGYEREVYAINGQSPGPLIEANAQDTIVVHVYNNLDEGQSIHWHGLYQNDTNFMDGVPGVTQCPIPPGGSFTYRIKLNGQYGTYWWHSHYSNSMADGLWGPLVIHSTEESIVRGIDYDEDRIIHVTDWMHDMSDAVIAGILSKSGYHGSIAAPQGDSVLINGFGQYNCDDCDTPSPAEIQVPTNATVRLRLINSASHAMLRVSIDNHSLEVVETDGEPVYGPTVHEIPVAPGERFSVLVKTNQGQAGDAFWLRAQVAASCIVKGVEQYSTAIFRYTDSGNTTASQPTTTPWSDMKSYTDDCRGLDESHTLTPRVVKAASAEASQTRVLDSEGGAFVDTDGNTFLGFGFNNVSYKNQIYDPLLAMVHDGGACNSSLVANATFYQSGAGNIILNNLDAGIDHPYHLHGNNFQLLARGSGSLSEESLSSVSLSLDNPPRKDTLWIPGGTWALLRITTDNPGLHVIHCHIGWHLAMGKLAVVVVQPDAIQAIDLPDSWSSLCSGTDTSAWGPAKRASLPGRSRPTETSTLSRKVREVKSKVIRRTGPLDN